MAFWRISTRWRSLGFRVPKWVSNWSLSGIGKVCQLIGGYVNGVGFFGGEGHSIYGLLVEGHGVFDLGGTLTLNATTVEDILHGAEFVCVLISSGCESY